MMRRLLTASALIALGACGKVQDIDPSQQIGPNPVLPKPAEELIAAVGVPDVVGWKDGEHPTVPAGFQIQAMATGMGLRRCSSITSPSSRPTIPAGRNATISASARRRPDSLRPMMPFRTSRMRFR